eukprot:gene7972-1188_t
MEKENEMRETRYEFNVDAMDMQKFDYAMLLKILAALIPVWVLGALVGLAGSDLQAILILAPPSSGLSKLSRTLYGRDAECVTPHDDAGTAGGAY